MKYEFINTHQDEFSIVRMCEVLGVSRSGYYKWLETKNEGPTQRETYYKKVKQKIKKSFHESYGTYGSPRVYDDLIEWNYVISEKKVARLMHEMGLRATPEVKYVNTTDSNHDLHVYPNLLNQEFNVEEPNRVWVADITYVWTLEGWLYLSSIMDLFSRKIVGWSMADHMRTELVLTSLNMALVTRQPQELIHHSDRGSQYCSNDYIGVLTDENKNYKIDISMSRSGNPYDNACIESFHATIKKDLIHRRRFKTRAEARKAINHYISSFYNERRKHSTLGNCSPNNFEKKYQLNKQEELLIN